MEPLSESDRGSTTSATVRFECASDDVWIQGFLSKELLSMFSKVTFSATGGNGSVRLDSYLTEVIGSTYNQTYDLSQYRGHDFYVMGSESAVITATLIP